MPRKTNTTTDVDTLLEGFQAKADAKTSLAEIANTLQTQLRGDVITPELTGELKQNGLGATATKSTNGADIIITLYHAYDHREVRIPLYQVENRLSQRFPYNTDEVPQEYWGKQVWYARDRKTAYEERPFTCRLSPKADAEIKADMKAAGLANNCRKRIKGGGWPTQFEADEHFRLKHPRRWKAYQSYITVREGRANATLIRDAMALAMTAKSTE